MNLFNGEIVNLEKFKELYSKKSYFFESPLENQIVFEALKKMQISLINKEKIYHDLINDFKNRGDISDNEIRLSMDALIDFISIDNLRLKLKREFGSEYPFELKRISFRENNFEAWYPLGVLVHITPNNSPILSTLAVVEGLLSGNVNVLKLARTDSNFSSLFFEELIKKDELGILKKYIYIGRVSSKDKDFLKKFISIADVISAWGNEESIKNLKEIAPPSARIVEWGHKISFSFFSRSMAHDENSIEKLAFEICNNDQQACSSPQCVFIEDGDFKDLVTFGEKLKLILNKVSPSITKLIPSISEQAEITVSKEQVRLDSFFGEACLIEASDSSFRIYIDTKEGLTASPLFRTIWIKPLRRNNMKNILRPLRQYLQTVGVACNRNEMKNVILDFLNCGVQRIRNIGEMTDSYIGEPHDGVFALSRYCQKISYSDNGILSDLASIEFTNECKLDLKNKKIMTKEDFQVALVEKKYSDLFFHSGGSSGEPKLSIFTYDDYHRQMELAAEGLFAAGLRPDQDRCMNLFYAGNLYGGFVSFFTILEKMQAVQFPMGASVEFTHVAETIINNNVDTILGMPSYIMQLFNSNKELFKNYKGIKKIFFGGEHMSLSQKKYLISEFSVEFIRSASYGSVDAGPLGYQCPHCDGGIHHLHDRLHNLEIVEFESDMNVANGNVGRMLFSSKVRHGQSILRYEIGDVGRIVAGTCPCGRDGTLFELMGRHGDVFRIGSIFLSYQKIQKILIDWFDFSGVLQFHLHAGENTTNEKLEIWIEDSILLLTQKNLEQFLIEKYSDLNEVVIKDKVLDIDLKILSRGEFVFNKSTGKLKSVIDHRINN